jgi:hypothetical protein
VIQGAPLMHKYQEPLSYYLLAVRM